MTDNEIGPVAWRLWMPLGRMWVLADAVENTDGAEPLYPQARINADAAEKAKLKAENDRLRKDMSDWREGDLQGVVDHMHAFRDRAEVAEARVKELEQALERVVKELAFANSAITHFLAGRSQGRAEVATSIYRIGQITRAALPSIKELRHE